MEQDEFIDRINIEQHRKYIVSVHKEIKRKNTIINSLRVLSLFIIMAIILQIVYLFSSLQISEIVLEKINGEEVSIYQNFKPELLDYSIDGAKYEIHQENYKNALIILKTLPDSDYKDWYSGLALLGLEDYENAIKYLKKIRDSELHTFHNELNLSFCSRVYLLKVRNYFQKNEIEDIQINVALSLN